MPFRMQRFCLDMLFFSLVVRATPQRPYHATMSNGGWTCNEGFFRTSAGDACQNCSEWRECAPNQRRIACTRLADVRCVACPTFAEYSLEGPDCTERVCAAGFSMLDNECQPCPVGFYCHMNEENACGPGETTIMQGAWERLQCVPVGAASTMRVQFWIEAPACTRIEPSCAGTMSLFKSVVLRGQEGVCTLQAQRPGTNVFVVLSCTCLIGPLQVSEFTAYLARVLEPGRLTMQAHLRQCLHDPYAVVYNVSWHQVLAPLTVVQSRHTSTTSFQHVLFERARHAWGSEQSQVMATLVFLTTVGTALLLSIGMISTALYVRRVKHTR